MIDAHIDRALTNISTAYIQDESVFIADKVFPQVPVQKQSDLYFQYDKGDLYRDEARLRGDAAESVGSDYNIEASDPYYCKLYALHKDVTQQERANYDVPLNADKDATEFLIQKMFIHRERNWATKYFLRGVWGSDVKGVAAPVAPAVLGAGEVLKFSLAASDPIKVVSDAIIDMAGATGFRPNTLTMAPDVFYALKNHEDILDRIKYTQKGIVTLDLLATLFEVEKVYVPWAVANDAVQGAADNIGFIMSGGMLLCHSQKSPAIKKPTAGYTFTWKGLEGSSAYGNRIVRIPIPLKGLGAERIESEMAYDHKIICADLGTFFYDLV